MAGARCNKLALDFFMDTETSPPKASSISTSDLGLPGYTQAISPPAYHPNPDGTEHRFELMGSHNKVWATCKVSSHSKSPNQLPTIFEGEAIKGSLELNLEKEDGIHDIKISLSGQVIIGGEIHNTIVFMERSHILWSRAMGDPRSSVSSAVYTKKLQGNYAWPFSIPFPKEVTMPPHPGEPEQTYRLPNSFSERHTRAGVQYEFSIQISRGRFGTVSRLGTRLNYVAVTVPDPPSVLRQLAYQENSVLPGPDVDPEGWKSFDIPVKGSAFQQRVVEARCTFSLAKPLCYTRGSVIPCVLVIETHDLQALDLLSSPSAIVVRLQRRVKYNVHAGGGKPDKAWKDTIDDIQTAVWWPAKGWDGREPYKRRMDGEIHLARELSPTSAVTRFSIDYVVKVLPFEAVAFKSSDTNSQLVEPVEIATVHASGPRPIVYSPHGFNATSKLRQEGFNLAVWGGFV